MTATTEHGQPSGDLPGQSLGDITQAFEERQRAVEEQQEALLYEGSLALAAIIHQLARAKNGLPGETDSLAKHIEVGKQIVGVLGLGSVIKLSDASVLHHPVQKSLPATLEERQAISTQIRQLRTASNLTQRELADRIGVSRYAIIRMEQGQLGTGIRSTVLLQRIFGLLGDTESQEAQQHAARTEYEVVMQTAAERSAIGGHVRQLRKAKGLTQQELADLVSVSGATISHIEHGMISTSKVLPRILEFLEGGSKEAE